MYRKSIFSIVGGIKLNIEFVVVIVVNDVVETDDDNVGIGDKVVDVDVKDDVVIVDICDGKP